MREKTINRKWQKLKYFGGGVEVGFLLLGLTISTEAKNIPETPAPSGPTKPSQGQSSPAPEIQLKIEGWRTYAFKNFHGRIGTWSLEIVAKHKQLASLSFGTY